MAPLRKLPPSKAGVVPDTRHVWKYALLSTGLGDFVAGSMVNLGEIRPRTQ